MTIDHRCPIYSTRDKDVTYRVNLPMCMLEKNTPQMGRGETGHLIMKCSTHVSAARHASAPAGGCRWSWTRCRHALKCGLSIWLLCDWCHHHSITWNAMLSSCDSLVNSFVKPKCFSIVLTGVGLFGPNFPVTVTIRFSWEPFEANDYHPKGV